MPHKFESLSVDQLGVDCRPRTTVCHLPGDACLTLVVTTPGIKRQVARHHSRLEGTKAVC